jgi:hypothetical protein
MSARRLSRSGEVAQQKRAWASPSCQTAPPRRRRSGRRYVAQRDNAASSHLAGKGAEEPVAVFRVRKGHGMPCRPGVRGHPRASAARLIHAAPLCSTVTTPTLASWQARRCRQDKPRLRWSVLGRGLRPYYLFVISNAFRVEASFDIYHRSGHVRIAIESITLCLTAASRKVSSIIAEALRRGWARLNRWALGSAQRQEVFPQTSAQTVSRSARARTTRRPSISRRLTRPSAES